MAFFITSKERSKWLNRNVDCNTFLNEYHKTWILLFLKEEWRVWEDHPIHGLGNSESGSTSTEHRIQIEKEFEHWSPSLEWEHS